MPSKKHVTFANEHGKTLKHVKHINKSGKGKKVEPAKRASKPAMLNAERMEIRRKAAEYAAKQHVASAEKKMKHVNNMHREMASLMKTPGHTSGVTNSMMKKTKDDLNRIKNVAMIDLAVAKNKLKAQRTLG